MKKAAKGAGKKPGAYHTTRFGILNPWGDVWTPDTFDTEERARRHVQNFWVFDPKQDLKKFKIVPVRVTVTPLSAPIRAKR